MQVLLGSERCLYERTGIPPSKIIHACWESEGYASPAWLLVQDDQTRAVMCRPVSHDAQCQGLWERVRVSARVCVLAERHCL